MSEPYLSGCIWRESLQEALLTACSVQCAHVAAYEEALEGLFGNDEVEGRSGQRGTMRPFIVGKFPYFYTIGRA